MAPRRVGLAALALGLLAAALLHSRVAPPVFDGIVVPLEAAQELVPGISAASRGQSEQQETGEANIGLAGASEAEPSPGGEIVPACGDPEIRERYQAGW